MKLSILLALSMPFYFFQAIFTMQEDLQRQDGKSFIAIPQARRPNVPQDVMSNALKDKIALWNQHLAQNQIPQAFSLCKEIANGTYDDNEKRISVSLFNATCQKAFTLGEPALFEKRFLETLDAILAVTNNCSVKSEDFYKACFRIGEIFTILLTQQYCTPYLLKAIEFYNIAIVGGIVEAKLQRAALYISTFETAENDVYADDFIQQSIQCTEQHLNDIIVSEQTSIQLKTEAFYHLGILYTFLKNYTAAKRNFFLAAQYSNAGQITYMPALHNFTLLVAQEGDYRNALILLSRLVSMNFASAVVAKAIIEDLISRDNFSVPADAIVGQLRNGVIEIYNKAELQGNLVNAIQF